MKNGRGEQDEQHVENMHKLSEYAVRLGLKVMNRRDGSFSATNEQSDETLSVIYDWGKSFEVWNYVGEPMNGRDYDETSTLLEALAG